MAERMRAIKRRRLNPSHRWTETQTLHLLQIVADAVKYDPELFEKPTAQQFYKRVSTKSAYLQGIPWTIMKSKVRHSRALYFSEATSQVQKTSDPLAGGAAEHHSRNIANWELLKQIFGHKFHAKPACDFETTQSSIEVPENDSCLLTEMENSETSEAEETCTKYSPDPIAPQNENNFENFMNDIKSPKGRGKPRISNPLHKLISIQEKKLELETKRFKLEIEAAKGQIELKKLELHQQFEIKKLEIEKDERVAMEKLRLESAAGERIQKYELKLKLIQSYKTS